ncbi:cyclin-D3-1-like, partial [Camellia sinensis]|uniref:cyclin-D3-1-like n=1 Tax=Camellia sinensis TaxID=4442 RepID=UPI00103598E0
MYNTSGSNSLPVEMDGVILPWLQWETANDGSPLPSKNKRELPVTPKSILWDATQVEESKFVFEAKIIQRMELLVLSTLQWKMNPVTPLSFVDHIVRRFGFETDLHLEFLWRCERLLLSAITDSRFGCYLPSVLAAATMLHVIKEVEPSNVLDCQNELMDV